MGLQGPRPLTQEPTQMMVTRLPFSGAYEVRQGLRAMMRWDLFRTEYEFSIAETTHYRLIDWIQHTFTFLPSCRVEVWRSLIGLQSRGQQGHILLQKLQGRIYSLPFTASRNENPLQYSCQENPMDRGVWWATVLGVTKRWTWLNNWACAHRLPVLLASVPLFHLTVFHLSDHSSIIISSPDSPSCPILLLLRVFGIMLGFSG